MKAFMYILQCADGTYYTGSTINLEKRIIEHNLGEGANYTSKRRPVKLVYFEEFLRIEEAFRREKQVQPWSVAKKEALIHKNFQLLHNLASCKNDSHCKKIKQQGEKKHKPRQSPPNDEYRS
jgi:putative endonuclease